MEPVSRPLETSCLVPGRDAEVLGDLPLEVVGTITSAGASSTRHANAFKWNLFVEWCSSHREDPGSARSGPYCPFCSNGWSEGCLPPPSKSMWLRLLPTTTPRMGSWWGGMTGSSLWLSTEAVAFSPRPHPYLPCFAPLSRERLSLHCSPN